jgi:hypothetical protein
VALVAQLSSYWNQIVVHIHLRINDVTPGGSRMACKMNACCYIVQHSAADSKEIL